MHLSVRQPRNPNYEEDIVYVTKHNKWVLNSIGMWPAMLKGIGKFVPKIVVGLSNFVSVFNVLQFVLYVILEEKDTSLKLRFLGLICFASTNLMKYWALIARRPNIEYCIEQVQTDWKQVEFQRNRMLMLKYGKIGRDLTIYSAVFMYSSEMCYITIMQYAMASVLRENNRTTRVLVYPTYSGFFDAQKSPIYEIVYVLQCMCTLLFNSVTVACCGLAALFATHACGQIDVVISQLNDLVDGKFAKKNSKTDTRLIEIVENHIKILKYVGKIINCMKLTNNRSATVIDFLQ
ncbi:uncharacterized protein LOC117206570 [Bombus bifarius]|uniref:Uncharacterized protein LOC117206570 n=1 Tax=Bombus bifarius TaxID=103933 RepID=A0A6P8M2G9_9HYME|nr:uncharacterized protein LOC117206570 [Bombus bifarius]